MSRSIGLAMMLLAAGFARAQDANAWLGEAEIPRNRLTAELNAVAGFAPEEAETEAKRLALLRDNLRGEGRSAAALLEAVAWERAGSASKAKELLELIVGQAEGTPFARSADVHLVLLEPHSPRELDRFYRAATYAPGAETGAGWFRVEGEWIWSTQRDAALRALAARRSGRPVVRALHALRDLSPFPRPYHYLFILLVLTGAWEIVKLPLLWRFACTRSQLRRLRPEIQSVRQIYANDFVLQQQHLQALYGRYQVRSFRGCWISLANVVFQLCVVAALSSYWPQMALDGSKFLWVPDVTRFDLGCVLLIVPCWLLHHYLLDTPFESRRFAWRSGCTAVVCCLVLAVLAWFWSWPAYVFLFVSLTITVSALLVQLLTLIAGMIVGLRQE